MLTFPFLRSIVIWVSLGRCKEVISQFDWESLLHSPNSPDLAHSDFHLFGPFIKFLCGTKFSSIDDTMIEYCKQLAKYISIVKGYKKFVFDGKKKNCVLKKWRSNWKIKQVFFRRVNVNLYIAKFSLLNVPPVYTSNVGALGNAPRSTLARSGRTW